MIRRIVALEHALIGEPLARNPRRAAVAVAAGLLALTVDFCIVWHTSTEPAPRAVAPGAALLVYLWLSGGDRRSVGLRLRPKPRWRFWAWVTLAAAVAVVVVAGAAVGYAYYQLQTPAGAPLYIVDPADFWLFFRYSCLVYPVLEEFIFRAALCTPLAPLIGPWPTVVVSGAVFAAVHFLYGVPSPDNFLAGYFLAWAYLKSGSIFVPIAFHALGNFVILFGRMGAWYAIS